MIRDLGYVEPGSTIYLPFHTFDSNDPSASVTLTGLATSDVEIYKDGSMTQRGSDNGYTLLDTDGIDLDSITGIHGLSINLADNTTAGFYAAGSQYWVVISSVTVDAATINFILCTFRIGYQAAHLNTTIATLTNQTSFTLTNGPAEDDALNGSIVLIHDVASAVQKGYAVVTDYTGSTKTVTLLAGTTFTAAASDNISFFPPVNAAYGGGVAYSTTRGLAGTALPAAAADAAGGLPISDAGGLDLDAQIGTKINDILTDTGTTLQGEIDGIQADTEDIQAKLGTPSDFGSGTSTIAANLQDMADNGTATFDRSTDSLQAIRDRGDAAWITATGFATAAALATAQADLDIITGTAGVLIDSGTGAGQLSISSGLLAYNPAWDAEIQSEVADALGVYDPPTRAELTTDINSILAELAFQILHRGSVGDTGNSTTAVHLNGLTYGNDEINGYMLVVYDASEDEYHWRKITDWVLATELATVDALPFTPAENDGYALIATLGAADVTGGDATAANQATIISLLGTPAGASVSADILVIDNLVDDLESRLGTPSNLGSGATVAANLADIEAQTDDIGAAGAGLTALATAAELAKVPKSDSNVTWNATALASIQSEATDALNAYDPPTNAEMEARTLPAADYFDFANDGVFLSTIGRQHIWDVATASQIVSGSLGKLFVDNLNATVGSRASQTSVDDLPTVAEFEARTLIAANYFDPATDTVANVTLVGTLTTYTGNTPQTGDAYAALTSAVPDSVPADGSRPTVQQAVRMILQYLAEKGISGTTLTVKKEDGSTTLFTCTLDDDTAPTSSTRSG